MERAETHLGMAGGCGGFLCWRRNVAYGQQTGVEPSKLDRILQQLSQLQQENQQLHREMDDLRRQVAELKSAGQILNRRRSKRNPFRRRWTFSTSASRT